MGGVRLMIRQYPNELRGRIDDQLYKRLEQLYNMVYDLTDAIAKPQQGGMPSIEVVRASLQAKGKTPLNVSGLQGILAQIQPAKAIEFSAFPAPLDPRSQDGALGILSSTGALYRYYASTRTWTLIP